MSKRKFVPPPAVEVFTKAELKMNRDHRGGAHLRPYFWIPECPLCRGEGSPF